MKIWISLLIALIVGGCARTPTTPLPDWTSAEREESEIAYPIELPELCSLPSDGQWAAACWEIFVDEYEIIAEGNTTIAGSNARALRKTEQAYDQLIEAGKLQQQLAGIRKEMLEDERRQREYDKWYYRAIIIGLVAVGVAK